MSITMMSVYYYEFMKQRQGHITKPTQTENNIVFDSYQCYLVTGAIWLPGIWLTSCIITAGLCWPFMVRIYETQFGD